MRTCTSPTSAGTVIQRSSTGSFSIGAAWTSSSTLRASSGVSSYRNGGVAVASTVADVRDFVKMLKDTRAAVEKEVKAGKTLQQIQQAKVLAAWQKYSGPFVSTDLFIETLYNELTGTKTAGLVKHN